MVENTCDRFGSLCKEKRWLAELQDFRVLYNGNYGKGSIIRVLCFAFDNNKEELKYKYLQNILMV